jgi:curved DNA-binding protein CbpA
MEGKLAEHPLAELIREITATGLTGALRLARERAKVAIYFESGKLVFATSNLRAHRLREVAKRNGLSEAHLAQFPISATDEELAAAMLKTRALEPETLASIQASQVSEVLRLALLWIDGTWKFEPRVRLADETRVEVDVNRLLLECARHLPANFVAGRLASARSTYLKVENRSPTGLLPAELVVLARAADSVTVNDLTAGSENDPEKDYRAIYALSLSGLLQRSDWPGALGAAPATVSIKAPRVPSKAADAVAVENDDLAAVDNLFARLETAKDHYEVLDLGRLATAEEIKNAYHALALRFHPDRFHQSDPYFRNKVESAFARIARAYETLSEQSLGSDSDAQHTSKPAPTVRQKSAIPVKDSNGAKPAASADASRAETSFQHGLEAIKRNRYDEGIRFLAEAAMLSPREARYRAHYGYALIRHSNTRRIAETELQTALSLEPENTSYRVMLAELYKQLGLQRRAEGELNRALAGDPSNQAARSLLLSLRNKGPKS